MAAAAKSPEIDIDRSLHVIVDDVSERRIATSPWPPDGEQTQLRRNHAPGAAFRQGIFLEVSFLLPLNVPRSHTRTTARCFGSPKRTLNAN
jgi:hypothetical protein